MPGWHDATRQPRRDSDVRTVGIVQEQHPDRARLFMQWKQMDWPVLVDAYDLLEVPYVPITLLVDEHGVIREVQPSLDDGSPGPAFREFVEADHAPPEDPPSPGARPADLGALRDAARGTGDADAWRAYADALVRQGDRGRLDEIVGAYRAVADRRPDDRWAHFRLGVALRKRFDSPGRRDGDFQAAVDHWTRALELDPNQYIFRRRLQQYGPRLDKPYPFYDWVARAREEIRARGGDPVALRVEPRGSEIAEPTRDLAPDTATAAEPDPEGRIRRDEGRFVGAETTVVPAEIEPGGTARVHVRLKPNDENDAHWNNEVDDTKLWVAPPEGWETDRRLHIIERPREIVSQEIRVAELELRAPGDASAGTARIPAYAVYYVCEGENGICVYRRTDLALEVPVEP